MFFETRFKKSITKLSLLVLGLTGVFSFCFAHEALAHPENGTEGHVRVVSEVRDSHCGSVVPVDTQTFSNGSTVQLIHGFVPVIAFSGTTLLDGMFVASLSPAALPRGRPPSLQPAQLQVFRC